MEHASDAAFAFHEIKVLRRLHDSLRDRSPAFLEGAYPVYLLDVGDSGAHVFYKVKRQDKSLEMYIAEGDKSVGTKLDLFFQACVALKAAYNECGLTEHGDITPSNIMVHSLGDRPSLQIGYRDWTEEKWELLNLGLTVQHADPVVSIIDFATSSIQLGPQRKTCAPPLCLTNVRYTCPVRYLYGGEEGQDVFGLCCILVKILMGSTWSEAVWPVKQRLGEDVVDDLVDDLVRIWKKDNKKNHFKFMQMVEDEDLMDFGLHAFLYWVFMYPFFDSRTEMEAAKIPPKKVKMVFDSPVQQAIMKFAKKQPGFKSIAEEFSLLKSRKRGEIEGLRLTLLNFNDGNVDFLAKASVGELSLRDLLRLPLFRNRFSGAAESPSCYTPKAE